MPVYQIQAPDGKTYRIEGPAGATQEQVQAEVAKQLGSAQQPPNKYEAGLTDVLRSLEQGTTYHWGDEINAAVQPGPYRENVEQERSKQQLFSMHDPWSNLGLETVGGAASGLGAAKLGQLALQHARGKAGMVADAAALIERMIPKSFAGKAAAAGAGAGAAAGAGSAPTAGDVPREAGEQGIVGGFLGPLSALVAKFGVQGATSLINRMRSMELPAGARKFVEAVTADKDTLTNLLARLQGAEHSGVPTTVGDVARPQAQALAQVAATRPGEQATSMVRELEQRNLGAGERVEDLVNKHLKPDPYGAKLEELQSNLYKNAKPLYDQAYRDFQAVDSKSIMDILGTPSGRKAGIQAARMMRDAGVPIGQADAAGMINKPSLQYLDYVKRALDDQINVAERSGATGQGKILRDMRNRLRDELDTATQVSGKPSPYTQARAQYAGDLEVRDALVLGRDQWARMSRDELQDAIGRMSYAEKDAFRTGAAEYLFNKVASTGYGRNPVQSILANPGIAQRLQLLFDSPREYRAFIGPLQQEMQNFTRAQRVVQAGRRGEVAKATEDVLPPNLGEAAYETTLGVAGHPTWMGARLLRNITNRLTPQRTTEQAAEIFRQSGPEARSTLQRLAEQEAALNWRMNAGNLAGLTAAPAAANLTAPVLAGE